MRVPSRIPDLGVGAASLLVVGATLLDTRIDFLNQAESDLLVVVLHRLQVVLGPAAILLFAFGAHWATKRLFRRALLALPALPVWSLLLVELPTFTGTTAWTALFLAPLRGLQPFGAPLP